MQAGGNWGIKFTARNHRVCFMACNLLPPSWYSATEELFDGHWYVFIVVATEAICRTVNMMQHGKLGLFFPPVFDPQILMYLDWKRSYGWLKPWEGLLLVTDVSTTCAEAINSNVLNFITHIGNFCKKRHVTQGNCHSNNSVSQPLEFFGLVQ